MSIEFSKPKYSRFGPYMILSGGFTGSEEDQIKALRELLQDQHRTILQHHGVSGWQIEVEVFCRADREATEMFRRTKSHGISEDLKKLLTAERKADAIRIAKGLTISQLDLVGLVMNCGDLGLRYHFYKKEFRPQGTENLRAPTEMAGGDGKTLTKEGRKFIKQIGHAFNQRQQLCVHLFENDTQHHFIFFDFDDMNGKHWVGGNHLHYSSHLWGIPKDETFKAFETKGERPPNEHIKYLEEKK